MLRERQLHVATWSASDDPRLGTVAGFLEADGFAVHPLGLSPADPQLVLMLPGRGGLELPKRCRELCQAHPNAPAMILHTAESEASRATIDYYGFELLPASIELAKVPEHVLKVLSPWSRFAELKRAATTLQHLESTAELVYFDFRPEAETFRPSRQLRELIGQPEAGDVKPPSPLLDRIHTADRALFAGTLFEAARSGTPFCLQIRLNDAHDRQRHFRVRGRAFEPINENTSSRVFAVCEDTTEHMQRISEAEARSRVDDLTGLGNRRFFNDCRTSALARGAREQEPLALLYIDLDRFKLINDTMGHDAGEQLLRVIAARLSDAVRARDVACLDQEGANGPAARVSRLGGDELTVLLTVIHGPSDAELVASRLLKAIGDTVEIAGQTLRSSASVGIAVFPGDGQTTDDLRIRADAALYAAKAGGGGFRFFTRSMEDGAVRRLSLEHELRSALDRDEIEIDYQPRIDDRSGTVVGAEALVRWTSPTLGRVTTDEVVRIAEDTGFVTSLGRWVLRHARKEAAAWPSDGGAACRLAVNVSPVQFEQDDVFTAVVDALKHAGLPPESLDLEITKNLLLREDPTTSQALEELRRMGVRIVLDHFGKGYSALAVLLSQPIDVLRLDRRLVETVAPDGDGSQLLSHVIRMAHDLSLHAVAEGVSQQDQAEFLASNGCDEMQGFLFLPALSPAALRTKLTQTGK
ncbi:MAG: EAL domain-containing protein [Deltaproteobacteria bacterium]|jgi:diguanylate cyclase (GGDEF)-like protein|nr:EAL domain-containing protein [Deltaproteobacteria bacterium]